MLRILCCFLFVFTPFSAVATAQIGDLLIYNGDSLTLYAKPLEAYFEIKGERILNGDSLEWTSTACYSGYRATWELVNDSLYLRAVRKGCYSRKGKETFHFDLVKEFGREIIFADWCTDNLLVPKGALLKYVHSGFASRYERELHLIIEKGKLIHKKEYDNSKTHISILEKEYQATRNFLYKNINWDNIPPIEETVMVWVSCKTTATHRLDSIQVKHSKRGTDFYHEEALRVVRLLPEWSAYYVKGKFRQEDVIFRIVFNEQNRAEYAKKE